MRDPISQISFADLELLRQGVEMEPALQQISAYLDRHPQLSKTVEEQLQKGLKKSRTGRRGLTGGQVLRSWILMRIKNWDYRELARTHPRRHHAAVVHRLLQQLRALSYRL